MPPSAAGAPRERESAIMHRILLALGQGATRLFRQNVGSGWVGQSHRFSRAETVIVQPGDVLVRRAQPLQAGLCVGSSDIIGWHTVEITADMVGQRVALFTALEVKTAVGRPTPEQVTFVEQVRRAGGRAAVVRSEDEARAAVSGRSSAG